MILLVKNYNELPKKVHDEQLRILKKEFKSSERKSTKKYERYNSFKAFADKSR